LAYLENEDLQDYLHDMRIVQGYADTNRQTIARIILKHLGFYSLTSFTTIHNYIDIKHNILRKGAVSAYKGENIIIPMNMKEGSLLCVGKGNLDWLYSAPHGAGRIMSRSQAQKVLNLEEYKTSMEGVYSTSVCQETIDESPMVYKSMETIMQEIKDTVDIKKVIKPLYNFKAKESERPFKQNK